MAESQIAGLFMTPEMYRQQQAQANRMRAMQYAQMAPEERAAYGFYSAGQGLGQLAGSLLGAQDPQLQRITEQQRLLQGLDVADPDSLMQAAKRASDMGNVPLAMQLAGRAQEIGANAALIDQRRRSNDPVQALLASGRFTPASVAVFAQSGNPTDLVLVTTPTAPVRPIVAGLDQRVINPETGEVIAPAQPRPAPEPQQPNSVREYQFAVDQGYKGTFEQFLNRQRAAGAGGGAGGGGTPYFQPVQTALGVFAFNARTGRVEPVTGPDGAPIVGASADPTLQGNIAGARAGATVTARSGAEAAVNAPRAIAQGEESIRLVDDLLKSPGLKQAVGSSRLVQLQRVPGTPARDFDIRLEQLKGQQFLQAYETLKGGGHITEVEGKKATDAISRMDASSTEKEFINAAREFQNAIRVGIERARKAQSQGQQLAPAGGAPDVAQRPSAASERRRIRFDAQGNVIP